MLDFRNNFIFLFHFILDLLAHHDVLVLFFLLSIAQLIIIVSIHLFDEKFRHNANVLKIKSLIQ
jgi:hypothetical protein